MASDTPDAPFSPHEALENYLTSAVMAFCRLRQQLLPPAERREQPQIFDWRKPIPEASPAGWQTERLRLLRPLPEKIEPTTERLELLCAFAAEHNRAVQQMLMEVAAFHGQRAEPLDPRENFVPESLRLLSLTNRLRQTDGKAYDTLLAALTTAELVSRVSREPDSANLSGQLLAIEQAVCQYPERTRYHTKRSDAVLYAAAQGLAATDRDVHALRRMMNLGKTASPDRSKPLSDKDDRTPQR